MTHKYYPLLLLLFTSICLVSCDIQHHTYKYPDIISKTAVDTIFGTIINDPYRNIENLKDTTVINWLKDQDAFSSSILEKINGREALFNKVMALENKKNVPIETYTIMKDGSYFYIKKDNIDGVRKLYYKSSKTAKERLIYNPENYKKGWVINYFKVSWDLTKVAISMSKVGEDESELIIYNTEKNTTHPEVIKNISPALVGDIRWLPDNSGFVYLKIPHFEYHDASYLLNTKSILYKIDSNRHIEIFSSNNNPDLGIKKEDLPITKIISENSNYVYGYIYGKSTFNNVYFKSIEDLKSNSGSWKLLFSEEEKIKHFTTTGDTLIYLTAKNAGNYKVCLTSINHPDYNNAQTIIEEKDDRVIKDFEYHNGEVVFSTLKNGVESKLYKIVKGQEEDITMPNKSGSSYVSKVGNSIIFSISGWTQPHSLYKYMPDNTYVNVTLDTTDYPEFDNFIVEEVEVTSHDGVLVPLSIIYDEKMVKNGNNRTIITGYGAYGDSMSPFFYLPFLTWVSNGGILAIPHVRGGGEKGDRWHKSGFKTTKSNSWKDFIACTEYLIDKKYTSKKYTIAYGVSAGGITVGRAITDKPDLYAVACMDVPSLNMLRSEFQPNGANSAKEFGTIKDSLEFKSLLEMDAYHHVYKHTDYPSIYISTGINDGIVTPWDPAKFVARIQKASTSGNPILFSINFEAGHTGEGTMEKYYQEMVNVFAFALWRTGHPDYQLKNN